MILLEDEKRVVKWLSDYGPLTKFQLKHLLAYKPEHTAEKILGNLRKGRMIRKLDDCLFGLDRLSVPNFKMILAVWVLIRFLDQVEPDNHRLAGYPAQVMFLKGPYTYEIVVIQQGEEYLSRLLQYRDGIRYIFVVPDCSRAALIQCPDTPCLFAQAQFDRIKDPEIHFYRPEELK